MEAPAERRPSRILVTGAAGFIGSHVAERLAGLGHEVTGLDCFTEHYDVARKEANAAALSSSGVSVVRADLRRDDLSAVVEGIDAVVHLAARPGLGSDDLRAYLHDNVGATARLVAAVVESSSSASLRLFVNVATSSVYGRYAVADEEARPQPISAYGISKLAAERIVMDAAAADGLPACSLRPFSVYGPRERPEKLIPRLLHAALTAEPFTLFEGSEHHRRSYTYVGDVAAAIVAALDRPHDAAGEVFNIGHPASYATPELIDLVSRVTGRPIPCIAAPRRDGDLIETHAVGDKARVRLGFSASTALEDGVREHAAWAGAAAIKAAV
jgi:UDP-glucuronate 4-epimerase